MLSVGLRNSSYAGLLAMILTSSTVPVSTANLPLANGYDGTLNIKGKSYEEV